MGRALLAGLLLGSLFIGIGVSGPVWAQEEDPVKKVDVSKEDLRGLVDLLEDPERRQVFIKHLQTLIQIQEEQAGEAAPPADTEQTIEAFSDQMDTFSEQIAGALKKTTQFVHQFPMFLSEVSNFLKNPKNILALFILLACALVGIFAGLSVDRIQKKYITDMADHQHKIPTLIILGAIRVVMNVLPYGLSLAIVHGLFEILPVLPQGREIILLVMWVFSIYKVSILLVGYLLSPRQNRTRILPLKDDTAAFLYRWTVHFAKYGGIYYIISEGILVHIVDRLIFFLLYHGLRAVFPVMFSIFIYKIALIIRNREISPESPQEEKDILLGKIRSLVIHFWHIPTIMYVWVVFLFSLGGYQTEFSYLISVTIGTLLIVIGVIASLVGVDYAFTWLVDAGKPTEPQFIKFARLVFKIILVVTGLFILSYVWGVPIATMITSRYGTLILARFLVIALTIGLLMLVMASSQAAARWFLTEKEGAEPGQKRRTLVPIINATIKAGAAFVALIVILDRLGVNVAPILAGAGIIGLGVGLGAQSLVKDLINGLFILFQDMISVGDWAQLGDKSGEVESISLRAVRIRDLSGNVHIIPNSAIDTVTNMTKHFSRYVFNVGVAYRENVDDVMAVLAEIGESLQEDPKYAPHILQPLEILGLNKFEDSAVVIRARITTRPMKQWEIGREFNRRMKNVFDERGIEIPFPHQTIYMGAPKQGEAPPLNLRVRPSADSREQTPEDEEE